MNGFEAIRDIYNLTLESTADLLGISKQSVSEWTRVGRSIPNKRIAELSVKLELPENYFNIKEVTERDKLEIKRCQLNKDYKETTFEYEDQMMDSNGNWETVRRTHIDSGLMMHQDYNDIAIKMQDLFDKQKDVIEDYKPAFGEEEWYSANDDIEYRARTISIFDRFTDIVKDNDQDVTIYQIMRAMELFFNVNVKKNRILGEVPLFPNGLVSDEKELVQKLVGVLNEHCSEINEKKKEKQAENQKDAQWLLDNFSSEEDDLY